jgi:hypothetical protein
MPVVFLLSFINVYPALPTSTTSGNKEAPLTKVSAPYQNAPLAKAVVLELPIIFSTPKPIPIPIGIPKKQDHLHKPVSTSTSDDPFADIEPLPTTKAVSEQQIYSPVNDDPFADIEPLPSISQEKTSTQRPWSPALRPPPVKDVKGALGSISQPAPEPEPLPEPEPTPLPVEEPAPTPTEPPAEIVPPNPTPEPLPPVESPIVKPIPPIESLPTAEVFENILQDGTVTASEVVALLKNVNADGKLTKAEKEVVAIAIVAQFIDEIAVPASAKSAIGLILPA